MEILRIENLSFEYPDTKKKALENINLSINEGEFVVVCGKTGCGKSTLLKMLKKSVTPIGKKSGKVFYYNKDIDEIDEKTSACEFGYVMQNPESQIITDKVWHELSFGLENMGLSTSEISCRIAETASYFGIENLYRKNTSELSGGQKQMLNLASVIAMSPRILILDEPTGQLDPIAKSGFISTLKKLNSDFHITVIVVEHNLEEVLSIADKVVVMEESKILFEGTPKEICKKLKNNSMMCAMPESAVIFNFLDGEGECPITVKDGREFILSNYNNEKKRIEKEEYKHSHKEAVRCNNLFFRYKKNMPDVLSGADLTVYENEVFALLGGNGVGKTTFLKTICGLIKPYYGKIKIFEKKISEYKNNSLYLHNIAMLSQNQADVFIKSTIGEDLRDICEKTGISESESESLLKEVVDKLDISEFLNRHPFDLSCGEQQKCAIAKMLLLRPRILILDEPTKGIDAYSKIEISKIIKQLKEDGMTVIISTHDLDFGAQNADRCAMLFDGKTVSVSQTTEFFSKNNYYTTTASKISRNIFENAVCREDVVKLCKINARK